MVKNIFDELKSKMHDEDFEPRAKSEPTAARPGSLEKLHVLATVSMEFEKAKYINKIFKQKLSERQHTRKAKHG